MRPPIWVRRPPTEADLRHANVPSSKWCADFRGIKEGLEYVASVKSYLANLKENIEKGKGLLLYGPYRSGKSCMAAIVVKEVAAHRCDPYWTEAFELVDGWFQKDERYERIRKSHLLVVDDLGMEAQSERRDYGREIICSVFRYRLERELPIVVTTNIEPKDLATKYGEKFLALILEFLTPVEITGMNWTKDA
jgi:DNA replication protein DnaC